MTNSADPTFPQFLIRLAEPRDKALLGQLGATLVGLHYAFDPHRFMTPQPGVEDGYAWFLGEQMKNPDAVVYVAEQRGVVVGAGWKIRARPGSCSGRPSRMWVDSACSSGSASGERWSR